MADKNTQPKKEMNVIEKFKLGVIDSFRVPIKTKELKEEKKKQKRGLYQDHGRLGIYHKRWLHHNEMLMHHKRIKRRRRRNEIAKQSRKINRAA